MSREIGSFYEFSYEVKKNIKNESDSSEKNTGNMKIQSGNKSVNTSEAGVNSYLDEFVYSMKKNGYEDYAFLSCGRECFMLALENIRLRLNKKNVESIKCLLPMYTCDTVVFPFEEYSCELYYYPVKMNFTIEREVFIEQVEKVKPDIILIHPYYGIDTFSELRDYLQKYRANGGIVIEDMTQSLFLEDEGDNHSDILNTIDENVSDREGRCDGYSVDYYAVSLRKWAGIPDGGLLVSKTMLSAKPSVKRRDFVEYKLMASGAKVKYLEAVEKIHEDSQLHGKKENNSLKKRQAELEEEKKKFLKCNRQAEEMLDNNLTPHEMSDEAFELLADCDFYEIKKKRQENALSLTQGFARLTEEYGNKKMYAPVEYTGNEAPIYFPVFVKNRDEYQSYMRKNDIFVPVLWNEYENIDISDEITQNVYKQILALPCDHRYSQADMERIIEVTGRYLRL